MSCKLYPEKNYAFVEFRTVEEASNCMALDGVQFGESHLRVSSNHPCHAFLPLLHASERCQNGVCQLGSPRTVSMCVQLCSSPHASPLSCR